MSNPLDLQLRSARHALAIAAVLTLVPAASSAATAQLVLDRDGFLWSEEIVLPVEGVDCPGGFLAPEIHFDESIERMVIDIDLLACDVSLAPPQSFHYDVPVGRLYPREYEVRVQDAIRHSGVQAGRSGEAPITPPPSPFDVQSISVHRTAQLEVEPVGTPTDDGPTRVAISGLASTLCFGLDGPFEEDGVYEFLFSDHCPILPPGGPNVFREERELGTLAPGAYEVRVLDLTEMPNPLVPDGTFPMARRAITVHDAGGCVPDEETLCLSGNRFAATVEWEDFAGKTGSGRAVPLTDRDASGLFWFFGPRNVEITLKVLDGCKANGHRWVFLSSGSDVWFEVVVRDTATGDEWTYENPLGEAARLVRDIRAFPCGEGDGFEIRSQFASGSAIPISRSESRSW